MKNKKTSFVLYVDVVFYYFILIYLKDTKEIGRVAFELK